MYVVTATFHDRTETTTTRKVTEAYVAATHFEKASATSVVIQAPNGSTFTAEVFWQAMSTGRLADA